MPLLQVRKLVRFLQNYTSATDSLGSNLKLDVVGPSPPGEVSHSDNMRARNHVQSISTYFFVYIELGSIHTCMM